MPWGAKNAGVEKKDVPGMEVTSYLTDYSEPEVCGVFGEASKGTFTKNLEVVLAALSNKPVCLRLGATTG